MYILTKFHKDWTIIVDFLLIDKFLASTDNYASPSKSTVGDYELPYQKRDLTVHLIIPNQDLSI